MLQANSRANTKTAGVRANFPAMPDSAKAFSRMIWAKRRFSSGDYSPYQLRLGELQLAMANEAHEFIMVGREAGRIGEQDIYIAVPREELLAHFDGFEAIAESDVPREIDVHLVSYMSQEEFEKRFTIRSRYERRKRDP